MAVTFLTNEDESRILGQTAPGGYGWGETKAADMPDGDANNALTTGLYRATTDTANTPQNCRLVFTQAASSGNIYQTAYCDGGVAWRANDHDSWSEWEWISKQKKTYELIATITVAPDADGNLPQHVIFSADSNGEAFALSDFIIKAKAGFVDGSKSTLYMAVNNGNSVFANSAIPGMTAVAERFSVFFRSQEDGCILAAHTNISYSNSLYDPASNIVATRIIAPFNMSNFYGLPVKKVDLYTSLGDTKAWVEGSTFELWGVRT